MWVKLGTEFVNLDHIVRVRFNAGWKNGQEEVVAELETFVRGDLAIVTRYRGADAVLLRDLFHQGRIGGIEQTPPPVLADNLLSRATTGTVPEL